MTASNRYFDDIFSTHVLIRDWLSGTANGAEKCAALLARFPPGFSMITPSGTRLDSAGLAAFFSSAAGSRPGLQMHITDLILLQQGSAGAVVGYREIQSQPGLETTERWSTVVYENAPDGRLLWRHLHETWVA